MSMKQCSLFKIRIANMFTAKFSPLIYQTVTQQEAPLLFVLVHHMHIHLLSPPS